jgi:NADH dehydrogenase FAD-containing subunit
MADTSFATRAWMRFTDLAALKTPRVNFTQASVVRVNLGSKTVKAKIAGSDIEINEPYDYLLAASGLRRGWPVVPQSLHKENYLNEYMARATSIQKGKHGVIVIGGG